MLQNPKMFAERNAEEFFRKKKENQMCNIGLMSVLDVKNLLDYKDLQREDNVKIAQKNREEELITKLNGIKDRRSNLWEMQRKGETIMIRLYEFYLKRQKQDLSNHIQMEMILRLKGDLEKYQIMTEYVAQLENLSIQRKKLNQKYKEIYPEINEKHDQIEMDKLKNKNLDELYLTQRNQRVEDLLNRMEYIQREQETIRKLTSLFGNTCFSQIMFT
ncbi:hypothetical protein PPERSA_10832 [Pseudocohnilembus persalinus]|uniref:DUF4201 domain-containing protein n=1 Tax=Pseudocohnilembus persalinus TaxID=266149 RepID=A0A0V0QDR1_PSEPJ|nr:hypothetical protein PPERSA_10832 [Pseudocohnilembus persalinus]|eukprot:KRX00333.1 hypothetical protein PPERSA_10832 [Pseudocohnilembus persalinus]